MKKILTNNFSIEQFFLDVSLSVTEKNILARLDSLF
jgi:hypothetical protein